MLHSWFFPLYLDGDGGVGCEAVEQSGGVSGKLDPVADLVGHEEAVAAADADAAALKGHRSTWN